MEGSSKSLSSNKKAAPGNRSGQFIHQGACEGEIRIAGPACSCNRKGTNVEHTTIKEWQEYYTTRASALFGPHVKCLVCRKFDADIAEGMVRMNETLSENGRPNIPVCSGCAIDIGNAYSSNWGCDIMQPGLHGWPEREPRPSRSKPSTAMRTKVFERDMYRCVSCGTHKDLSLDHIIAVANGGSNEEENLQTLCSPCNSSKGKREGWRGRRAVKS